MDADRFENLLRAVATRSSRRGFAGLLGGLALGGVLALEDQDDGSAKNRRRRSRRHKRATDPFKPSPILPPPPYRSVPLSGACATPSACVDWFVPGQDGLSCPVFVDRDDVPCPWVTCAPVDAQKGAQQCTPGTQCCRLEKAPCGDDCQCCGSLTCENRFCARTRTCVELSGSCSSSSLCCRGYACLNGRCVFDQPQQG